MTKIFLSQERARTLATNIEHQVARVVRELSDEWGVDSALLDQEVAFAVGRVAVRYGLDLVPDNIDRVITRAENSLAGAPSEAYFPSVNPVDAVMFEALGTIPVGKAPTLIYAGLAVTFSGREVDTPHGLKMCEAITTVIREAKDHNKARIDCDSAAGRFGYTVRRVEVLAGEVRIWVNPS